MLERYRTPLASPCPPGRYKRPPRHASDTEARQGRSYKYRDENKDNARWRVRHNEGDGRPAGCHRAESWTYDPAAGGE